MGGGIPNGVDALRAIVDVMKASNEKAEETRQMLKKDFIRSSERLIEAIRDKRKADDTQDTITEMMSRQNRELDDYIGRRLRSCKCAGMFQKPCKDHHVVDAGNKDEYWEQRRYEIAKAMLPVIYTADGRHNTLEGCCREAVRFADALIYQLKK